MKRFFVLATTVAMALSSCSKNEVTEILPTSDDISTIGIDLAAGLTRGTETTVGTLEKDNYQLDVHCYDTNSAFTGTSTTLEFIFNSGEWAQDDRKWSDLLLPASFYCVNDGSANVALTNISTSDALFSYTVDNTAPETHKDVVYMTKIINSIPSAGKIYGVFDHALSRVKLQANTSANRVYILSADFKNVMNDGTATISYVNNDNTIDWIAGINKSNYDFAHYNAGALAATGNTAVTIPAISGSEFIAQGTADGDDNVMIIPQTFAEGKTFFTNSTNDPNTATMAYVEVMYRLDDEDDGNIAGYAIADNHPDFSEATAAEQAKYTGTPLFVKAAFPFDKLNGSTVELTAGKSYTLNLMFDTYGGILMDKKFYDQNGDPTPFETEGVVTEPVIPSADNYIGLYIDVNAWEDGTLTDDLARSK